MNGWNPIVLERQIELEVAQKLLKRKVEPSSSKMNVLKPLYLKSPWSYYASGQRSNNDAFDWFLRMPWVIDVTFSDEFV